jgi:hypothetical protein
MPDDFYSGTNWEQSSGPFCMRKVAVADLWPEGSNAEGTKDDLAAGLHPVLALGGRTTADGRPENRTGVVVNYVNDYLVEVNWADQFIVRQYVSNILTYSGVTPLTFETAPVIGQPIYVDDSQALTAGVTLSMSPLNEDGLANPLAGHAFYCQDEYRDGDIGGANAAVTWPLTIANAETETEMCVMLTSESGQACCDVA